MINVIALVLNRMVEHIGNSAPFIRKIGVGTFLELVIHGLQSSSGNISGSAVSSVSAGFVWKPRNII